MTDENEIYLVPITAASLLLVVAVSIFVFFTLYRRKQHEHSREKESLNREFQNTLLNARIEISEQTLQNISQEIHDNIGQRLTLASMQLNDTTNAKMNTGRQLIHEALQDLRNISKNLSGKFILDNGLELAIDREVSLIRSMGIESEFSCYGDSGPLSEQEEVILFRCVQEALHNALRHSGATHIRVTMKQNKEAISILVSDNGRGINTPNNSTGQGLSSMRDRMKLLGGTLEVNSHNGANILLSISPKNQQSP